MTAIHAASHSHPLAGYSIDLDHFETLTRTISALTIDPFKSLVYYALPFLSAYTSGALAIRPSDPAQEAMMPQSAKQLILKEIEELKHLGGIRRAVHAYTALNHHFSSWGGSFSATTPILSLPFQHLFRPGKSPFGQERPEDRLSEDLWRYTDDETRFLIARELPPIKENGALLRIGAKIFLLAAYFFIYTSPFGWISGTALLVSSFALYFYSEKKVESHMDLAGAELLGKKLQDPQKALRIAIGALEKMRLQNLARRDASKLSRLYISKSGNNLLDLNRPFLTTRIGLLISDC